MCSSGPVLLSLSHASLLYASTLHQVTTTVLLILLILLLILLHGVVSVFVVVVGLDIGTLAVHVCTRCLVAHPAQPNR